MAGEKEADDNAPERERIMDTLRQLGLADKDLEVIDGHLPVIIKAHEWNRKAMELLGEPKVASKLVSDLILKRMGREPKPGRSHWFPNSRQNSQQGPQSGKTSGNGKRR
jgi:hypothetical protein